MYSKTPQQKDIPLTAFNLVDVMMQTVKLAEKLGISEETAIEAHRLLYKYLNVTVTNRNIKVEIAEFIRETYRDILDGL